MSPAPVLHRPSYGRMLLIVSTLLWGGLACQSGTSSEDRQPLRLNATGLRAEGKVDPGALFDRDTTTGIALDRPLTVTLSFAHDVDVQRLKVYAQGPVEATLSGSAPFEVLGGQGWESLNATAPNKARQFTLRLAPRAAGARVDEVELWGAGLPPVPRDVQALAERSRESGNLPFENVHVFSAQPDSFTLSPRGLDQGPDCGEARLVSPIPVRAVRRAHLVYEADGVQRPVVLRRSLNGQAAQGGFWLGNGTRQRTLADELNPELLTGTERVTLCLPAAATSPVTVKGLRVVLEMDDGRQPFEREMALRLGAALDGDERTAASLSARELELNFARPLSIDDATVVVDVPTIRVSPSSHDGSGWTEIGEVELSRGRNALALGGQISRAVRFSFAASGRPDVPVTSLSELTITGSGVGSRIGGPRLVFTYPAIRAQGDRLVGERFGDRAYIAGWAESPAGPGRVEVDGIPVDTGNGAFGLELARPEGAASWSVTVRARFPDGAEVTRVVTFDEDRLEELNAEEARPGGDVQGDDVRFGQEEQTSWGRVRKESGGEVTLGERVRLEAPPGAVADEIAIGITRKMPEAVPRLDPGMVNVTAPRNAAYRFSPPGQKFLKPVKVTLPYDPALLPEGVEPEQVQTFFFDRAADQWKPLPKKQVLRATEQVVSETTHFTFMINAVLALPDHPGPTSFDPNSIKDLKAADPSANIDLIEPPEGNNQGSARLSLPVRLPQGRGDFHPSLQVTYDSGGGNGWLGVGWDLSVSSVQVDTRFGAPFYDGSERYMLDGEQLVPLGEEPCVGGGTGKRYAARVEQAFRRIVRCGAGTDRHRFEVTDKDGTLFVYGATAQARLASASDPIGKIGQWMLERVLDPSGNLTLYRYEQDRKRTPGTAFDAANGEDFRQLYLHEIYYSGRATREAAVGSSPFPGTEAGIYLVRLLCEADGTALKERPDVLTAGRMGFKVVTRYRLGRVQVRMNTSDDQSIIREYRLTYEQGDFSKSRLVKVEQFGVGGVENGTLFHQHRFNYTSAREENEGYFSSAVPWPFQQLDDQAMTASEEWALGAHAYVGIGPGPSKSSGSVGLRVGFNHREGETNATLLDLNGDGLPDRVSQSGGQRLAVQLNQGAARTMSSVAPPWDPRGGQSIPAFLASGVSLGRESGDSLNAAIQGTIGSFSANVGLTQTWSRSSEFMMDADGDRLVDYLGPGGVLFNQTRGPGACAPERFCFEPSKPVSGILDFSNLAHSQGAFASDSAVATAKTVVKRDFHPTDAMLEWTAPYTGTVNISGVLRWRTPPAPSLEPERDGVRLRVYHEGTLLAEYIKPAAEASPTEVSTQPLAVQAYERLYFVLSTQAQLPVDSGASPPIPLEAVEFAPLVEYTACNGCGTVDLGLKDPTGASLFRFDAAADFKIAGEPLTAIQAPRKGTLKLTGEFASASTADDVRICIQRFPVGEVQSRACRADDPLFKSYSAAGVSETLTLTIPVEAGDSLVFKEETDLSINPARVRWTMLGEMLEVCEPDGSCHPPADEERNHLRFQAEPYLPVHAHMGLTPLLRPLVVPKAGKLHISSSAGIANGRIFFSGRQPDKLLFKHGASDGRDIVVSVQAGEQITFEAHSETRVEGVIWDVDAMLEVPGSDAGVELIPLDAPQHVTYETHPLIKLRRSPFGGGFHGWRYGLWGGKATETFDPTLFTSDSNASYDGDNDRERFRDAKTKLRDNNTEENRRSRLYAPLLPRQQGTRLGDSLPGLYPQPAYVSQDGTAFIAAGLLHGGHKGSVASGPGRTRTVDAALRIGETSRASVATSYSAGISAGPASLSLSTGTSSQRMDVLDMNGDGIIDIVVDGEGAEDGVRLTHLRDRVLRKTYSPAGRALRENSDLTASVGMGLSSPVPQMTPGGKAKGVEGMFPSAFSVGAGLAATLSATDLDLVDINGDGLPDQVRRSGNDFMVRLNLGSSFAAREDRLPVGRWNVEGPFDPFVNELRGVQPPQGEDDDERAGREDALSVLEKLSNPEVVRRSTAVSLEGNFSVTLGEDYGVTANWSSSLSGTQVVLTDITGDGLPDYVRKSSSEGSFRVKVNRGYGFGPEEVWPVPEWPTDVTRPRFKVNKVVQSTVVELLGLKDGIDTVEATGSHSALPSVGFVVTVPILIGPGTPWLHLSGGADFTPHRVSGFELGLMDIDGDGLADHVLKTEEQIKRFAPSGSRRNREGVFARLNQMDGGNLLKRVNRPLGGQLELSYVRQGNTVDMPDSRFVLSEVVVDEGSGKTEPGHRMATQYTYEGGRYNRAEREFHGFATVKQRNPDGGQVIRVFHNDNFTRKGLLVREEMRDAQGKLFVAKVHQYGQAVPLAIPSPECMAYTPFFLSAEDYCSPSFTPLERTEHRFYEGLTSDVDAPQMVSAQITQYDVTTGNVTLFEDLGDVADPADDLHARVEYAHATRADLRALYLLELPSLIEVRAGRRVSPGEVLRLRRGEYDAQGNVSHQYSQIDSTRVAVTALYWNADGLLERFVGSPNANGQRYEVLYAYEPKGRALTTRTQDSFGYSSQAEYDLRFGEVTRTVDVTGNSIGRRYDGFGRLTQVWGPYEPVSGPATIDITYETNARPAWALTRNRVPPADGSGDTSLDTVIFVDGLARIIQTKKDAEVEGAGVGVSVTGHIVFDNMGRVAARGQTFFDAGPKTSLVSGPPLRPSLEFYDVLGRTVRTVGADLAETRIEYGFGTPSGLAVKQRQSKVIDALNNVRVMYRDVSERVSAVEEWIEGRKPTTRYETDALGQTTRIIDAAGNTTSIAYDMLGQRTQLRTPDTGLTEFRHDDAGNLIERIDPNLRAAGLSLRYEYEFNRLRRTIRPYSGDITYEYGPPGAPENAAGRVTRIVDEVGQETRGYGRLGEVSRTTRTVRPLKPGDRPRTFETRFGFDSFGRMLSIVYPDSEEVRYTYDAGGLLRTATGYRPGSRHAPPEVQVYLRSIGYDEFGQRVSMAFGNEVRTKYTYEPDTRRLSTVSTRTPRGRTLQALSYRYDKMGNVLGQVNALGQPVGRRAGAVAYEFRYDQLYRLTAAKGVALARPGLIDQFSSSFAYSDIHNMVRSTQVHELVSSRSVEGGPGRPERTNYDNAYEYQGAGPHQSTRIGDTLLTYDLNGNTLIECRTVQGSGCDGSGGTTGSPETRNHYRRYVWTEENQLRAMVHGGGDVTRFFYDAEGERVAKLGRGGVSLSIGQFFSIKGKRHGTKHVFAGSTRVASKLLPIPDGDIGYEPPPGNDSPVPSPSDPQLPNDNGCDPSNYQPQKCPIVVGAPVEGMGQEPNVRPATYYYHPDHLGSTSWVTDQVARVHEHVEYFPYGEVWRDQRYDDDGAPVRGPQFLFSGKEFDEETGLGYFGARYYDPRKARWISPDPFREEWGTEPPPVLLSLYTYANHSPLVWRDPTGKVPEWLHAALDVAGMVPVIGEIADGANALIYVSEGRYAEAAISAAGMIPIVGEAGKAGKWVAKGVKAGLREGGERVVKQQIKHEVAQKTTQKVVQQTEKKVAGATRRCAGSGCGVPGKLCFVAGTPVTTRAGIKPIEQVQEGEEVLARDPETGELDWRPVLMRYVTPEAAVITVTLVAPDGTRESLGVTPDHPFYVEGRGWTNAKDLVPGSRIFSAKEAWLVMESVSETLARKTVYNFEVADFHTYFVGLQQAWVHNNGCGEGAFETAKAGGKHAGFLKNYLGKSQKELRDGIRSLEKQIAEHKDKIANPQKHIPDWSKLDPRQQQALINKKWPGDIQRQTEQMAILKGLLGGG